MTTSAQSSSLPPSTPNTFFSHSPTLFTLPEFTNSPDPEIILVIPSSFPLVTYNPEYSTPNYRRVEIDKPSHTTDKVLQLHPIFINELI